MTRFKELRRIERAIDNRDVIELRWAEEYCKWRLEHGMRKGDSRWRRVLQRVRAAQTAEK